MDQHRLATPCIEPDTGLAAAWKAPWHDAGLLQLRDLEVAILRGNQDRQPTIFADDVLHARNLRRANCSQLILRKGQMSSPVDQGLFVSTGQAEAKDKKASEAFNRLSPDLGWVAMVARLDSLETQGACAGLFPFPLGGRPTLAPAVLPLLRRGPFSAHGRFAP